MLVKIKYRKIIFSICKEDGKWLGLGKTLFVEIISWNNIYQHGEWKYQTMFRFWMRWFVDINEWERHEPTSPYILSYILTKCLTVPLSVWWPLLLFCSGLSWLHHYASSYNFLEINITKLYHLCLLLKNNLDFFFFFFTGRGFFM